MSSEELDAKPTQPVPQEEILEARADAGDVKEMSALEHFHVAGQLQLVGQPQKDVANIWNALMGSRAGALKEPSMAKMKHLDASEKRKIRDAREHLTAIGRRYFATKKELKEGSSAFQQYKKSEEAKKFYTQVSSYYNDHVKELINEVYQSEQRVLQSHVDAPLQGPEAQEYNQTPVDVPPSIPARVLKLSEGPIVVENPWRHPHRPNKAKAPKSMKALVRTAGSE